MKDKPSHKDQKLKSWLKKGGREGSKPDFFTLFKRVVSVKV